MRELQIVLRCLQTAVADALEEIAGLPEPERHEDAVLSAVDAAKWLSASVRHVYSLCERGELGHVRSGRRILIPVKDLHEYVIAQRHGGPIGVVDAAS